MIRIISIASLFFWLSLFGQTDTSFLVGNPCIINSKIKLRTTVDLSNECFKTEKIQELWRKTQYKSWEEILTNSIDVSEGYECPEIAVELIGKELEYRNHNYPRSDEERTKQEGRIDTLKNILLKYSKNQNPLVRAKSNFLLADQLIWFEEGGRKGKLDFLKKYVEILDSESHVLETGQNFGPNLFDYRKSLRTLIIGTAKFDDPALGSIYLHKLKETFANSNYESELIRDAAYYYAMKEDLDSSMYYLNQLTIEKTKYRFYYYSGYFEIQLLNWLNNHFDPYKIYQEIQEFDATIPDSIENRKDKNEIDLSRNYGYADIQYQYYPDVDGQHRIVKLKDKKLEAIFEPGNKPISYILFEKGKLNRISYMNPLKTRINTFKRFIMEYDEDEMIRKLHLYTGVYQIMVIYNKKNRGKYYLDRKKVKKKIVFPMIKKYFLQEGLSNFFTYHIPGGYEEMNGL